MEFYVASLALLDLRYLILTLLFDVGGDLVKSERPIVG